MITPPIIAAALLLLIPYLAACFFASSLLKASQQIPQWLRILAPSVLCLSYATVAIAGGIFRWHWLALYAIIPIAIAFLMHQARTADPEQHGNWRDYLVLIPLGLAVDLRWLEPAWPPHLAVFNKILLLDAGIYGLVFIRQLNGAGFNPAALIALVAGIAPCVPGFIGTVTPIKVAPIWMAKKLKVRKS